MIGSGNPNNRMPCLSGSPDENVLNGVVQNMTHGQNAGHVGRGDDDGVGWLLLVFFSGKATGFQPLLIEAVFDFGGLVGFFHGKEN